MTIIEPARTVDDTLAAAITHLLPQLSHARAPTVAELSTLLAQPGCTLLVARDRGDGDHGGGIAGLLVLTVYRILTGLQARIDDVVVNEAARGRGIGEALTRAALDHAREAGAASVTLTSRPSREAANRLYVRLGFQSIATNVYRYSLR
jgi:ribosomal protein S18 acetylase RimI-like enzyme